MLYYICHLYQEKGKNKQKSPGLAHILKRSQNLFYNRYLLDMYTPLNNNPQTWNILLIRIRILERCGKERDRANPWSLGLGQHERRQERHHLCRRRNEHPNPDSFPDLQGPVSRPTGRPPRERGGDLAHLRAVSQRRPVQGKLGRLPKYWQKMIQLFEPRPMSFPY